MLSDIEMVRLVGWIAIGAGAAMGCTSSTKVERIDSPTGGSSQGGEGATEAGARGGSGEDGGEDGAAGGTAGDAGEPATGGAAGGEWPAGGAAGEPASGSGGSGDAATGGEATGGGDAAGAPAGGTETGGAPPGGGSDPGGEGGAGGAEAGGTLTGGTQAGGTQAGGTQTGGTQTGGTQTGGTQTGGTQTGGSPTTGGAGGACVAGPHCECVDDVVVARDDDGDGHGTMDCAAAPGDDCDDTDDAFVVNECGGCVDSPLVIGDPCGTCGVVDCGTGDEPVCVTPAPAPDPRCASTGEVVEECIAGTWQQVDSCSVECVAGECVECGIDSDCPSATPVCLRNDCVECEPQSRRCGREFSNGDVNTEECDSNGSWQSDYSCTAAESETCSEGRCVTALFHPRDASFEITPGHVAPRPPAPGRVRTEDVLDRITGFSFA